jgi:hypothetical protein
LYHTIQYRTLSFAGHESFPLRFAWLKKGYDGLARDPTFFNEDDAMVELGVGKNMVRAIRHWGLACQLWEEVDRSRGRELNPTDMGHRLLADSTGWDPFLEDVGTIWWLHWLVVTNSERATTWRFTFSRPTANRFTKDELLADLKGLVREERATRISDSTLKGDIAVMLRGYNRPTSTRGGFGEDAIDSPFGLLNLIRPGGDRGTYEIVQGPQPTLPTAVFEAALVDYLATVRAEPSKTATLDELLYAPLSPGRTFRLSEDGLVRRLATLVDASGDTYAFDETAGLRQLLVRGVMPTREQVLTSYYASEAAS